MNALLFVSLEINEVFQITKTSTVAANVPLRRQVTTEEKSLRWTLKLFCQGAHNTLKRAQGRLLGYRTWEASIFHVRKSFRA
jgi:hypothetical protein